MGKAMGLEYDFENHTFEKLGAGSTKCSTFQRDTLAIFSRCPDSFLEYNQANLRLFMETFR